MLCGWLWDCRGCQIYVRRKRNCPLTTLKSRRRNGRQNHRSLPSQSLWLQLQQLPSSCKWPGNKIPDRQQLSDNSHLQWRRVYRVTNKFIGTHPSAHSAKQRADLGIPKSPRGNRMNETQKTDKQTHDPFQYPSSRTADVARLYWRADSSMTDPLFSI